MIMHMGLAPKVELKRRVVRGPEKLRFPRKMVETHWILVGAPDQERPQGLSFSLPCGVGPGMVRGRVRVLPSAAGPRGSAPAHCTSPSACCTAAHWPGLSLRPRTKVKSLAGPYLAGTLRPSSNKPESLEDSPFFSRMYTALFPPKPS